MGRRLAAWLPFLLVSLLLLSALALPMLVPAIALWTGRSLHDTRLDVAVVVLIGVAAHASTGILTSSLLATGRVGPVVRYKLGQLLLALVLLVPAARIGLLPLAIALSLAFALPALIFFGHALRALDARPSQTGVSPGQLIAAVTVCIAIPALIPLFAASWPVWAVFLVTAVAACVAGLIAVRLSNLTHLWPRALPKILLGFARG